MSVAIRTATRIRDQDDFGSTPGAGNDGYAVTWDNATAQFVLTAAGGGGVTDHGALTGLADNDHTQYRQRITNWLLVDPAGKGDYTTITAALAAVTSPSSTNQWLIDVLPGTYNESFSIPTYTTVRSVIPRAVIITAAGSVAGGITNNNVILLAGAVAALDGVRVENTSLSDSSTAICVQGANYSEIRNCAIYRQLSSGTSKQIIGIAVLSDGTLVKDTAISMRSDGANNSTQGVYQHYAYALVVQGANVDTIAYGGSAKSVYIGAGAYGINFYGCRITSTGHAFDASAGSGTIYVDGCTYSGSIAGLFAHADRTRQNDSDATFLPNAVGQTPLITQAIGGQTAHLFSAKDSSGNVLFAVEADGDVRTSRSAANTNTPAGATSRQLPIYDAAGSLLGYIPIYGSAW